MPLKAVSREDLAYFSKRFGLSFTRGVSAGLNWNGNPDTQHPTGLFIGTDKSGNDVVFASLQNGAGKAERITCPT
jgi:hypothetical protein